MGPSERHLVASNINEHSVALALVRDGKPHTIGSGTCIELRGRYFIATAGHNLTGVESVVPVSSYSAPGATLEVACMVAIPDPHDLGIIEVTPTSARASQKRFLAYERLFAGDRPDGGAPALIHGYPAQLVPQGRLTQDREFISQPIVLRGSLLALDYWPQYEKTPLDPDRDLVLELSDTSIVPDIGEQTPTPDVRGVSGGGVWTVPDAADGIVWSAERSTLIGIQRARHGQNNRLQMATQLRHWVHELEVRFFGEA